MITAIVQFGFIKYTKNPKTILVETKEITIFDYLYILLHTSIASGLFAVEL